MSWILVMVIGYESMTQGLISKELCEKVKADMYEHQHAGRVWGQCYDNRSGAKKWLDKQ